MHRNRFHLVFGSALLVSTFGCGDSTGGDASESASSSGSGLTEATSTATTTAGTMGESDTATTNGGTGTASATSSTTSSETTSSETTTSSTGSTTTAGTTDSSTTSPGTTDSTTTGVDTNTTDSTDGTTEGTTTEDTTTGVMEPCKPGDGMGMGMIDKSFIWVPATDQGTVAKVNTQTLVEVARYRTGPSGGTESGSRTAVSADGRFVVVNARGTGRTTMVAANLEDCIDTNNNGMIETSQNSGDVRAWGTDECVIWSLVHADWSGQYTHGPRGVTWTPGDWDENLCQWVDPKVWLGYISKTAGQANLVRLDGLTGAEEEKIPVAGWIGSNYAPYGAALDPQFRPWFGALRGEIVRVNTDQDPITVSRWTMPGSVQSYGFTVDQEGNPWMAGCSGPVSTFDPNSQQVTSVAGTSACHRGITVDKDFQVWVASNSPCGLVQVDGKSKTLVAKHTLKQCSTAIGPSMDLEGYLWVVDQGGWAFKIDTKNVPGMVQVPIPGNHYVYSDMTGGQVLSVIPQ
ncbi:MAG: lyase [Nannocystaceae bacterium]